MRAAAVELRAARGRHQVAAVEVAGRRGGGEGREDQEQGAESAAVDRHGAQRLVTFQAEGTRRLEFRGEK